MEMLRAAWAATAGRAERLPGRLRQADERGQTLAEYSLILSFIAIGVVISLMFLGAVIVGQFWDPISAEIGKVIDLF